jgi:hypothetical protein
MLSTGCWFSDQRPFFLHPDWLFLRSLQEQLPKERISKEKRNHQAAAGVESSETEQKASEKEKRCKNYLLCRAGPVRRRDSP